MRHRKEGVGERRESEYREEKMKVTGKREREVNKQKEKDEEKCRQRLTAPPPHTHHKQICSTAFILKE